MSATQRYPPIAELKDGDKVVGFALLTKKELRQDRNGRDYLDLELTDASGSVGAKVWSDSRALTGDYDRHDFVAFRGTVTTYRDRLQVNVKECRRVTEVDRQNGFEESRLIPSTRQDIDELYERLERIYREEVRRPVLRRLAVNALATHGATLREHPAAKSIHHAYRGGLLEHVVSMAELALKVCEHYSELDRDLVLLGVLFHDLGKIREIGAMPVNDYTREGSLVGHLMIGRDLLRESCSAIEDFPADLQLELEHLILSHQGRLEFGSPVEPMTAEALALHFIDDLDSKLAQLRQAREHGDGFQFLRGFGRYVWLGEGSEPVEAAAEQAAGEAEEESDQPGLDLG
ncbi:MAG: HD domain-containing protein [Thermoanaerobaculia bacterium]